MKVLHFINNLRREGAQVVVNNLVGTVGQGRIDYLVAVRQPGGALVGEIRARGIPVLEPERYYRIWSLRQSLAFMVRICVDHRIRIIHAHLADAAFLAWLTARKLKLPLVITHHGHDILPKCGFGCRAIYFLLLKLAARYAAVNIAVSPSVADQVRRRLQLNEQQVRVIANGVPLPDRARIDSVKATRMAARKSGLRLINVGRLVPLKGQRQLISAMAKLVKIIPHARLTILGDGELLADLKQMAEVERVASSIDFAGAVDDVGGYLARADIYLSCSEKEGMPVSILEAMAWELPVVASDIPGNRSVVKEGETGYLFELHNTDRLVDRVVAAFENPELTAAVASRGRRMVEREFSAAACERSHADLYQELLG